MTDDDMIHQKSDREILIAVHGKVCQLRGEFNAHVQDCDATKDTVASHERLVQRGRGAAWLVVGAAGLIGGLGAFWDRIAGIFTRGNP